MPRPGRGLQTSSALDEQVPSGLNGFPQRVIGSFFPADAPPHPAPHLTLSQSCAAQSSTPRALFSASEGFPALGLAPYPSLPPRIPVGTIEECGLCSGLDQGLCRALRGWKGS